MIWSAYPALCALLEPHQLLFSFKSLVLHYLFKSFRDYSGILLINQLLEPHSQLAVLLHHPGHFLNQPLVRSNQKSAIDCSPVKDLHLGCPANIVQAGDQVFQLAIAVFLVGPSLPLHLVVKVPDLPVLALGASLGVFGRAGNGLGSLGPGLKCPHVIFFLVFEILYILKFILCLIRWVPCLISVQMIIMIFFIL